MKPPKYIFMMENYTWGKVRKLQKKSNCKYKGLYIYITSIIPPFSWVVVVGEGGVKTATKAEGV